MLGLAGLFGALVAGGVADAILGGKDAGTADEATPPADADDGAQDEEDRFAHGDLLAAPPDEDGFEPLQETGPSQWDLLLRDPWAGPEVVADQGAVTGPQSSDDMPPPPDRDVCGTPGDDALRGGAGQDTLSGGASHDWLAAGAGDDVLEGGAGDDTLEAGQGDDNLAGGEGDDVVRGHTGDDTLRGGAGHDNLVGGAGDDDLRGGGGDDTLAGGYGDDRLHAGAGADLVFGGHGADVLDGRSGEVEEAGPDLLNGGAGDDVLLLGAGDTAYGGPGADLFDLAAYDSPQDEQVIGDFDPEVDRLVVRYDPSAHPDAELSVQPSTDDPGSADIMLDGVRLARVAGGAGLTAADIEVSHAPLSDLQA